MSEANSRNVIEAPSSGRLLRSLAISVLVAAAILVAFVLPAEYGVDPTGIGRALGLTAMGETKVRLAREEAAVATSTLPVPAAAQTAATPPVAGGASDRSDVTEIRLGPGRGKEIKLDMRKGASVAYAWTTSGGAVDYDTHADSPTIKYHGYAKGKATSTDSGRVVAAFDGRHGWYWRNRGADTVVLILRTKGDYQDLKRPL